MKKTVPALLAMLLFASPALAETYVTLANVNMRKAPDLQAAVQRFLLEKNCFFRGVGSGILGIEGDDIFYAVRIACCDKFGERISGAALEHILRAVVDTCADVRSGYSAVMSTGQGAAMPADIEYLSMLRV